MDAQLSEIIQKIVAHIHPVRIFLFGSRAHGYAGPNSDYDLVIIYDGEKSKREVKLKVHGLFSQPSIAMDVLVLTSKELEDYKHIANTLAREVTENGVVVFG